MKDILRQQLKSIRSTVSDKHIKNNALFKRIIMFIEQIFSKKDIEKSVFIYQSFSSEVETAEIIAELSYRNYKILIPQVDDSFIMEAVDIDTKEIFSKTPSITIVPLLGFNKELHRIGFGKGCYDNYFFRYSNTIKIGLAFDEQICDFLHAPYDVALDYIITPMLQYCRAGNCRQV